MKFFTVYLSLFSIMLGTSIAQAQIKPDNTLGVDRSILNNNLIQGGAQRGTSLFHSFTDFSIGASERIDFANPTGVKNIITRVTDAPSNINGTLGVLGSANLFFINPNGISFGANARLDMGGTFVGSTASGVKFADGNIYSAVNPQAPLLTMTIPVGLQFGSQPGKINFTASTSLLARDTTTNYGGSSFLLAGGDITLTSSKLILPNGKIEMVAVNDVGSIDINPNKLTDPKSSSIDIPTNLKRADIVIQNGSRLNTSGTSSGNIDLQAANITISGTTASDKSVINARSTGDDNSQSGNVNLNATGDVLISGDFSGISTSTFGKINGGNIQVDGQNLIILDGAYLETTPYSLGNGGNISIHTTNSVRLGAPTNGKESDIITSTHGKGNSGNISIETGKLIQGDGSQIITDNLEANEPNSTGKLGSIKIVARESVEVSGVSTTTFDLGFPLPTSISSFSISNQDAGNIDIQTPKFALKDGAVIAGGTERSLGGTISITGLNGRNAESVEIVGNSNLGQFLGTENVAAFAGVGNGSRIRSITSDSGNAGSINIKADRVSLQGGSRIDVRTLGSGEGGSIDIQAKTVELVNGGQLISTTKGGGGAGKINVRADNTLNLNSIDSTFEAKRTFLSFITVINNQPAAKQALNDYLQNPNSTSQQLVFDYWQQINNNIPDRQILAGYFTLLQDNPTARATLKSFLTNTAKQASIADYNILLNVGNSSGIVSRSLLDSTGNGGNINVTSPTINIRDGAAITASSDGTGRGGNIMAKAESIELNRGSITAKTLSANGGEIDLTFNKLLLLRNQSEISASAATNGNGGNITIVAPQGVIFAVPNENSDIIASAIGGKGGIVEVDAKNVLGFSYQSIDRFSNIAATSTFGSEGIVTITTPETEPNRGIQPEPVAPGAPNLSQVCPGDFPKGRLRQRNPLASTLMDSGNGGAAPRMRQVLRSEDLWTDGRMRDTVVNMPSTAPTIEIAQGWIVGNNRTVVLTSQANGANAVSKPAGLNCYAP